MSAELSATAQRGPAEPSPAVAERRDHDERTLFAWVEETLGGRILSTSQTSGGNRARSWAMDVARPDGGTAEVFLRYAPPRPPGVEPYTVHREAQVYRAIHDLDIRAPRLIAEHPTIQAILTTRAHGIAEYRRLTDAPAKQAIIGEVMADLARLHAMPADGIALDGGIASDRIVDHVRREVAIWRAMYEESGRRDALIELAFAWLEEHCPDPDGPVVLAHGDLGPGNFLFEDGRLTALIDWELAHLGDPMGDLGWFSMRCVMEPVPDFAAALRAYAEAGGAPIDRAHILYHRVLVSARVVVIRHRNVTGEAAHAIVSRALNRRLLVEALAEASGTHVEWPSPVDRPETARSELFAGALADLRDVIVPQSSDRRVVSRAKGVAKVMKYLEACDRYGEEFERAELDEIGTLLGSRPASLAEAHAALVEAVTTGAVPFPAALGFFAAQASRDAQLAAGASGGIARRHYPPLPDAYR